MKDMPLSKFEIYKNNNKFLWTICLYQNSIYTKTLISFMNDMPLSKFEIHKNTNTFNERYASMKIQNIIKR